jgi:uncharacterized membrane protein YkvA (DUF1232 family)
MANNNRGLTTPGFFQGLSNRARLVVRLMGDKRVSPFLKLLPIGALIYLVVPTDLMPLIPIDDAAILWLGSYMFIELCPQDIVQEHWERILQAGNVLDPESAPRTEATVDPTIVDAEFHEVPPDKP